VVVLFFVGYSLIEFEVVFRVLFSSFNFSSPSSSSSTSSFSLSSSNSSSSSSDSFSKKIKKINLVFKKNLETGRETRTNPRTSVD